MAADFALFATGLAFLNCGPFPPFFLFYIIDYPHYLNRFFVDVYGPFVHELLVLYAFTDKPPGFVPVGRKMTK